MVNPAKVFLKIISVKGTCVAAHQVGQEFDLNGVFEVGISADGKALCPVAFHAAFPYWRALRYGGEFPWEKDKDVAHVACPDPFNPVVMELRRVRE
ncbi:MAG TPA: TIGR04076 family protein [Thermodesulfobacteriota bacterium]|nr:TIGR04076 family protein [Thermodesulfobacteriota bacterium]